MCVCIYTFTHTYSLGSVSLDVKPNAQFVSYAAGSRT